MQGWESKHLEIENLADMWIFYNGKNHIQNYFLAYNFICYPIFKFLWHIFKTFRMRNGDMVICLRSPELKAQKVSL